MQYRFRMDHCSLQVSKELRLFFANLRHKLDERQEMLEDELERMFCDAANHAIDGLATYGTKRSVFIAAVLALYTEKTVNGDSRRQ